MIQLQLVLTEKYIFDHFELVLPKTHEITDSI